MMESLQMTMSKILANIRKYYIVLEVILERGLSSIKLNQN